MVDSTNENDTTESNCGEDLLGGFLTLVGFIIINFCPIQIQIAFLSAILLVLMFWGIFACIDCIDKRRSRRNGQEEDEVANERTPLLNPNVV